MWNTFYFCVKCVIFSLDWPIFKKILFTACCLAIFIFILTGMEEQRYQVGLNLSNAMTLMAHSSLMCDWLFRICSSLMLCVWFNWAVYFNLPLSDSSRKNIFLSLLVASIVGTLSFLVLRKSHHEEEMLSEEEGQSLLLTGITLVNILKINMCFLYCSLTKKTL